MKKVLVIYYTQTGQLTSAVKATLQPLEEDPEIEIYYELIVPKVKYPYPWKYVEFFDIFPETVHGIPCQLEAFSFDPDLHYDLIILAYQPWFLSICIPINSFLQSHAAKKVLANKPVITVIACRNMWLMAQEKMKRSLIERNAKLVGNIAFVDKSANLISLITVLAFILGGVKDRFLGIFPKYGVKESDLDKAPSYGKIISKHFKSNSYSSLQQSLNEEHAVTIKPNLMIMEGRGKILFPIYANYISKKGIAGSKKRRTRVIIFGIFLPTAILILSPIITLFSRLAPLILSKKMKKEMDYFSQNTLR